MGSHTLINSSPIILSTEDERNNLTNIIDNTLYFVVNSRDMYIHNSNTWYKLTYTHPTSSGNKHIPSGGSSGQILKWSASGTAAWENIHPIGSIYLSVDSTSPASLFGGTWEQIKDVFLLGSGSTYTAGSTGGEQDIIINYKNLPGRALISVQNETNNTIYISGNTWSSDNYVNPSLYTISSMYDLNKVNMSSYSNEYGKSINNMPPYLAVYMWKRVS